jgi:peptidoglycan/LPS O-acetylase OafA/YrhL
MASAVPRFRDVLARSHFPALDGLRAVAVFVVILGHEEYPIRGVPADLGVDAFFVLSGFLITRLLMREQEETGAISLSRFYARRTMRIFPAYYVFLALNFAWDTFRGERWSAALGLSAVTYTVNYYNALNHHPSTSIAHAWSLGIEEQFYLLWPLAFLLLARKGRRALVGGVTVLALVAIIWRSYLTAIGTDVAYLYNAFDTRLDNLAVGCALALVADRERVGRIAERLAHRSWYPLLTIAALVGTRELVPDAVHYSAGFTIYALLVAILIAQLMQLTTTPLWSWLENPAVRYLGTISYPMYLYHGVGASVARHTVSGRGAAFIVSVLATIALATGSYFVIERPFLKLKKRFASSRGTRPPAGAGSALGPAAAPRSAAHG